MLEIELSVINSYINLDEENRNKNKIDKYWLNRLLIGSSKQNLNTEQKRIINSIESTKENEKLQKLIEFNALDLNAVIDLYLDKQENSEKRIALYQISEEKQDNINNLIEKITSVGGDYYNFFQERRTLCKRIEQPHGNPFNLIYINKHQREDGNGYQYHFVYSYKLHWLKYIKTHTGVSTDDKTTYETACISIDTHTRVIQIRIGNNEGIGKIKANTPDETYKEFDDIFDVLKNKFITMLEITEDDITPLQIETNIENLFKKEYLVKYEGMHKSSQELGGSVKTLNISFKLDKTVNAGVDYMNMNAFKDLQNRLNRIILIKGVWDRQKAIKGPEGNTTEIFIRGGGKKKVVFNVNNSYVRTYGSYTKEEMNYALSHVTENL
jgi:hypothetical protein